MQNKFKTPKSEVEEEFEVMLKKTKEIIDGSCLTNQEAIRILDYGCKLLVAFERIRKSRDKWRNKFTAQNDANSTKSENLHVKSTAQHDNQ